MACSPKAPAALADSGAADAPIADAPLTDAPVTDGTGGDSSGPPCLAEPIGDHGVGRPCSKGADCLGQMAVTCLTDLGPGAPSICTEYCFGFPGECQGGVCMLRGKKAAVCVPVACAARYTVLVPSGVTCTKDCNAPPTPFGVGKACLAHEDCTGQIAKNCPYVFRPDNQKWCTMLCSEDAECGAGAVCWRRLVSEQGVHFLIGSCANAACCWQP